MNNNSQFITGGIVVHKRQRQHHYIFAVDDDDQDDADILSDSDGNIKMELEESNSCTSNVSANVMPTNHLEQVESHHLEESSQLEIMNSLGRVFEDTLMEELDSDLLGKSEMEIIDDDGFIMQHMDIQEPLSKLRQHLEVRLHLDLSTYEFTLQDTQMLEPHKTLVDQCVQGEGLVQVNLQLQHTVRRINIVDVLKPAEDYLEDEIDATTTTAAAATTTTSTSQPMTTAAVSADAEKQPMTDKVVQWQLDLPYKREQERLRIPSDPRQWNVVHVRHWVQWAVRQFNLPNIKLADWSVSGERLYQLTIHDFQRMAPNDTNDIFWTHFELLRKMKMVATIKEGATTEPPKQQQQHLSVRPRPNLMRSNQINRMVQSELQQQTARYIHNGPIQLWQFLLELLTSREHRHLITWESNHNSSSSSNVLATAAPSAGGEFKLLQPEEVATLWGDRKNKPTMNYEKLSRALRYYYDGDMISKVAGKRFVYKFVCDLRQVLGYSAAELANLVRCANPNPQSS